MNTASKTSRTATFLAIFSVLQPFLLNLLQDLTGKLSPGTWPALAVAYIVAAVYIGGRLAAVYRSTGTFSLQDVLDAWQTSPSKVPSALAGQVPVAPPMIEIPAPLPPVGVPMPEPELSLEDMAKALGKDKVRELFEGALNKL